MPQFDTLAGLIAQRPAEVQPCVLLPVSSLEDFPVRADPDDARSLLAAWTVLYHPAVLAATRRKPIWARHDLLPGDAADYLFSVPRPTLKKLDAEDDSDTNTADAAAMWITGENRQAMLAAAQIDPSPDVRIDSRTVGDADFFAAGYVSLQVQVMTRRLRYTSNLDELHFETRLVDAADAFVAGNAQAAAEALHDVFDALAEERDHYFASDPHLIDLQLVAATTLGAAADSCFPEPPPHDDDGLLPTPTNYLIDHDAVESLSRRDDSAAGRFRESLRAHQVGWAGGGPAGDFDPDLITDAAATATFADAFAQTERSIGAAPKVFGRLAGGVPIDLIPTIARLDVAGVIPIDFAGGGGYADEAKVLLRAGGKEIEALTAKPIDASRDSDFLDLGATLGAAIDGGEIATGLLVRWPGGGCDSFHDVRVAASWCLAMGRFWRLDEYFTLGERPYHHGTPKPPAADDALRARVATDPVDPTRVESLAAQIRSEVESIRAGLRGLAAAGQPVPSFAECLSATTGGADVLLINDAPVGRRVAVSLPSAPARDQHIFAVTPAGDGVETIVDVPALGFVVLRPTGRPAEHDWKTWLREKLTLTGGAIAGGKLGGPASLSNEFMEVVIDRDSGGISGAYSGAGRGNRLSMRIVGVGGGGEIDMQCDRLRVENASKFVGEIHVSGQCLAESSQTVGRFDLTYRLQRGSRRLELSGEVTTTTAIDGDPWKNYLAVRLAVPDQSATVQAITRDRLRRPVGGRFVSPAGYLIDEADRRTTVLTGGHAFHRKTGGRFFDTLIHVAGQTPRRHPLTFAYGFDLRDPVAQSRMVDSIHRQAITTSDETPAIGWLTSVSPASVLLTKLDVSIDAVGRLNARVRLIATRSGSTTATLRFCHGIEYAALDDGSTFESLDDIPESRRLDVDGERIKISLSGHASADVIVAFRNRLDA